MQAGLRSGDLWVPGSRRYTDPSTLLLPPDRWAGQRDDFCTITGTDPSASRQLERLEYSRNLIFADGTTMQRLFDAVVDRTRSRLDVPTIRTIFGTAQRPRRTRKRSSTIEAAIETPTYDLMGTDQRAFDRYQSDRGRLITEPLAGEHCCDLELLSIPRVRSCPGRLVRSPVALMGCRAVRALIH